MYTVTDLCARFGISRKTAYKWIARYEQAGPAGLNECPRTPHTSLRRTSEPLVTLIRVAREQHPTWGPPKLRVWLCGQHPEPAPQLPAVATIGDILQREGLIRTKPHRRRWPHPNPDWSTPRAPNLIWSADFKGEFRTQDGQTCYPLTVEDVYSRFLFACSSLPSVARLGVQAVFERVFRDYGLPEAIRTDIGVPFASSAICGLTCLNVCWIRLGIRHQRITPGRPQQNGRHEQS